MTPEAGEPLDAVRVPAPAGPDVAAPAPPALPGGAVSPGLIGHLARSSPAQRKRVIEGAGATAGNRSVIRMLLRAPGKDDPGGPQPYPWGLRTGSATRRRPCPCP